MIQLRDWQDRLKDRVINDLKDNCLVLLQAPTGSGKTLFALLASLSTDRKVIYAVKMHNEYEPVVREVERLRNGPIIPIEHVLLAGKEHSCLRIGKEWLRTSSRSKGKKEDKEEEVKKDYDCSKCIYKDMVMDINVKPSEIKKLAYLYADTDTCPYQSLLRKVRRCNLIVCTYPYVFKYLDLILKEDDDLSNYVIVIDEAHNLEHVHEMDDVTLTARIVNKALESLKSELEVTSVGIDISKLRKVKESLLRLRDIVVEVTDSKDGSNGNSNGKGNNNSNRCIRLQDEYIDKLREIEPNLKVGSSYFKDSDDRYINHILKFFAFMHARNTAVYVNGNGLEVKMLDPSYLLDVLNAEIGILLMSGTLPSKDYLRDVYGINRDDDIIKYYQVDGNNSNFTYSYSNELTSRYEERSEEMYSLYASTIADIYSNADRHVLALFPSYNMLYTIIKLLPRGIDRYAENRGSTLEGLKEYCSSRKKVLIMAVARGKFSEGIELVEGGRSLISDVVIAGMPFKQYDDYVKDSLGFLRSRINKDRIDRIMLEEVFITVRQAIGRSVRSSNDKAKVWLLDRRFDNRYWRWRLQ